MAQSLSGRNKDVQRIRRANRASAVGRLMLGEFTTWQQFLEADAIDLDGLPRRQLKSAVYDIKSRLAPEIENFCTRNFQGMTQRKLAVLYEDIKVYRGFELPLSDFEEKFAVVRRKVLKGNPSHATVSISLWGLQFRFPEADLSNDLTVALQLMLDTDTELEHFLSKSHSQLQSDRDEVARLHRQQMFAVRSSILTCYNLAEAYIMGLAWDFARSDDAAQLSNRKRKMLEDKSGISLREKLTRYPEILTGRKLWIEPDRDLDRFVEILKPYRDALVHASPFQAPEKFGGYDKLRLFYRADYHTAMQTTELLMRILHRIHRHIHGDIPLPEWISDLDSTISNVSNRL